MEKVVSLLKDLSKKVAAEGEKEAAQYDKFACFCKEQADEKLYNIEKSDAKIKDLTAEIDELNADINKLSQEISKLSKEITSLGNEIDRKTEKREKQHAVYQARAQDMNEAIDAAAAAIKALRDHKNSMKGAKVTNLVQILESPSLAKTVGAVSFLAKLSQAPKFQYQSNDIIATIEDLMAEFKQMKKDLDFAEHDTNSAFEKDRLGLQNEKKFKEKDRAEKEAISEDKTESMNAKKSDRSDEDADRNSDNNFMKKLTEQCEDTAQLFDQRSKSRADELTALSEATTSLQEGAAENYKANKKLNLAQVKAISGLPSFVQVASVQKQDSEQMQRVRDLLSNAAERTGSKALSAIAVRVSLAADHFVKVRGLIKDLIAKLKADAEAEATQKKNCDLGMSRAIEQRDKANAAIEAATGKITTYTANANSLKAEINSLTEQIAEHKKELNEATELRNDSKADNKETVRQAKEGKDAVEDALEILGKYYGFVQTRKYVPPNADRDGNTLSDLSPGFASEEYHGAGSEAKGIVGILEVILSDFQRTIDQTRSDEDKEQSDFEDLEKDLDDSVRRKNNRINKAKGELRDTEADILEEQQELKDTKENLANALEALEELEGSCVKGEETWEERKQKRLEEIEALKEALNILEDWQN